MVPVGSGWAHEQGEICDGNLYGRGVTDDKGPAVACIYAMKDLLDSGIPIRGRFRILFGMSEENGDWVDMEYYVEHEELPDRGFTPDADFPLIFAEKGISMIRLNAPCPAYIADFAGGTAPNVVPDTCMAQVLYANGEEEEFRTVGVAAHGSMPDKGVNAISRMMELLYERRTELAGRSEGDRDFLQFWHDCIDWDHHGEHLGIDLEDEVSGKLTFNPGVLNRKDGKLSMMMDLRYPVSADFEVIKAAITAKAEAYGVQIEIPMHMAPISHELSDPFLQALLAAYREETGDLSEPICIGGGTYARAMPHIAAFGPMLPGRPMTEHQRDEYMALEDLHAIRRIYAKALRHLAEQQL